MKEHQNSEIALAEEDEISKQFSADISSESTSADATETDEEHIFNTDFPISDSEQAPENDLPRTTESLAARLNIPEFNTEAMQNAIPTEGVSFTDIDAEDTDEALEETPVDAPEDLPPLQLKHSGNIFRRLHKKHTEENERRSSETELIRKKSNLTEDDVALALELGYEDELGRLVGYEGLKKLKQEHRDLYHRPSSRHYRTAFGYIGKETINDQTSSGIISRYLHDQKRLILRTVLTTIAAFLLLFLDYPELWGGIVDPFIAEVPLLFPILSLIILIAVSALSFRQINAGLRSFFMASPTPYSVPATTLLMVILYDVVTLFLQEEVLRVNMLTCALLIVLALCDVHRLIGEIRAFSILTLPGEKTVLEPVSPRKKTLRRDGKIVKVINDDSDVAFYRVQQARQITGFFRRFNTTESAHLPFQLMIGINVAFAVIIAFIAAVIQPSLSYALSTFITVIFVSAPTTAMFSFFYPLQRANKILSDHKCVLVGNEAVTELSESKTLIFDDVDLYSAERRAEIIVKDGDDLHRDLKLAGTLLRTLGGTLDCLSKTVGVSGEDPGVAFLQFADNGVEALIDGTQHVILGDAEYLKKHNVRIPKESADQTLRRTKDVAVLHFAVDGIVKFTYEIEYVMKLTFEAVIKDLARIDTSVAIQSYDPAINDAFLLSSLDGKQIHVRAIKPGRYEGNALLDEADSGAVSLGNPSNIVYPLCAAKTVKRAKKFGMRLQFLVSAIGILTAGFFALSPAINILTPLSVTLYHGAFILITWLFVHKIINRRTIIIRRYL